MNHNRLRHESGYPEQTPIYEGILQLRDRAVMATFVANLTGYGPNSDQYTGPRSKFIGRRGRPELLDTYGNLCGYIEKCRWKMELPTGVPLTPEDTDRLVAGLSGDEDFIKTCARSIEDLSLAVDYGIEDKDTPSEHLPSPEVVDNFKELRGFMVTNPDWQGL